MGGPTKELVALLWQAGAMICPVLALLPAAEQNQQATATSGRRAAYSRCPGLLIHRDVTQIGSLTIMSTIITD